MKTWKVMPCPKLAGKHPYHDTRWIATEDAEVEWLWGGDDWRLSRGGLIAEMRDGPAENARLIAAAPELLEAMERILAVWRGFAPSQKDEFGRAFQAAQAAVAKAKGNCGRHWVHIPTGAREYGEDAESVAAALGKWLGRPVPVSELKEDW